MKRQRAYVAAAMPAVAALLVSGAVGAQNGLDRVAGAYEIYLGITPAAVIARNYAPGSSERTMHGGVPSNPGDQHLMIAVFNRDTGQRVANATVTAKVWSSDGRSVPVQRKPLQSMSIAGSVTYGNYFFMPSSGRYDVRLSISVPGLPRTATTFTYAVAGT